MSEEENNPYEDSHSQSIRTQPTNRDAIKIGIKSGLLVMAALFLLLLLPMLGIFGILGSIAIGFPGVVTGIIGALVARWFGTSLSAIWVGGILGAILSLIALLATGAWYGFCPLLGGC